MFRTLLMSDFEERDFFWKSWKKKKKQQQKTKKKKKKKDDNDDNRVRDVMVEQKEKKPAHGLNDCLFLTQQKVKNSALCSKESQKKKKKKKKVVFDLSAGHVPIKRPTFVSSSPGSSRGQAQVSDDDVNSQDLFITQKIFRQPITELHSPEGQERSRTCLQDEDQSPVFTLQKTESLSFQRFTESKLTRVRRPDPLAASSTPPDVTDSQTQCCPSKRRSGGPSPLRHVTTQTENLFTPRLSSYLLFCQTRGAVQKVTPLDLSLPTRTRNHLGLDLSLPTRTRNHLDQRPASLPWSQVKAESSGDPRKDKSVDATASSEDGDPPCDTGRLDLTQVRAVQTRLNESFFFKTKGDEHAHRPESPLMKLTLGRDMKSRKSQRFL
ncbi:hypothetical protein JOB18_047570 [Solea senegalensis]|uniref:Uncharacterized protein n=1 Tax=Solea senegalensis TaxID=28829 RepID=A0AAV6PDS4_SOLSE|nr:hypothetical protein JOB18_047570 [Solea senegalensis]